MSDIMGCDYQTDNIAQLPPELMQKTLDFYKERTNSCCSGIHPHHRGPCVRAMLMRTDLVPWQDEIDEYRNGQAMDEFMMGQFEICAEYSRYF
jgi:hypothetical protein